MRLLAVSVLFLLLAVPAGAATYTANSCSYSDVQSAYNSATNGDIINIPPGDCTWSNTMVISKGVHFAGAGSNATHIHGKFKVGVNKPNNFSISGVHLEGPGVLLCLYGTQDQFHVYDNLIQQSSGYGITVGSSACSNDGNNYTLGVIEGNSFVYTSAQSGAASPIVVTADGTANAYSRPSALGKANMVFIEDNLFDRYTWAGATHATWAQDGGSYVFRYNKVINLDLDVHGQCSWYGAREFEIYGNDIICESGVNCSNTVVLRGGSGVFFDNTVTGRGLFRIYDMRLTGGCNSTIYPGTSACTDSGVYENGQYPLEYGLGRGQANTLEPIYSWDNSWNASSITLSSIDFYDGSSCDSVLEPDLTLRDLVVENRDWYFQTAKPNYIPYTYPHPLTGEGCVYNCDGEATLAPGPPSQLKVEPQ